MKIVLEIPDSINDKKKFSKEKLEREILSLLFLKLYQEGFIAFKEFANVVSLPMLKQKKNLRSPGKNFLKLQGIWKDRSDINNSLEYLNTLRKKIASREI